MVYLVHIYNWKVLMNEFTIIDHTIKYSILCICFLVNKNIHNKIQSNLKKKKMKHKIITSKCVIKIYGLVSR